MLLATFTDRSTPLHEAGVGGAASLERGLLRAHAGDFAMKKLVLPFRLVRGVFCAPTSGSPLMLMRPTRWQPQLSGGSHNSQVAATTLSGDDSQVHPTHPTGHPTHLSPDWPPDSPPESQLATRLTRLTLLATRLATRLTRLTTRLT